MASAKHSGLFANFGGRYVPEMLVVPLEQLAQAYDAAKKDPTFRQELQTLQRTFNNRPTALVLAENLTKLCGGAQIYLKNEGLNHTGAHKINHCLGQALLARRMGKTRLIAETGAGQHGLATATVAAKLGLKCTVYMGAGDIARQRPNVFFMEQLGAEVVCVNDGSRTLKDAVNAALKDYMASFKTTHYVIGSVLGPDPYPRMNRDFQAIIGKEIRQQLGERPDVMVACVGGGSNAIGMFYDFLKDPNVRLVGVEAGGSGPALGQNAIRMEQRTLGVLQGYKSYFVQDKRGNIAPTYSISAGLDYPGIGPELAMLGESQRIEFTSVNDQEAITAFSLLARTEGILPALESSHAVAAAITIAKKLPQSKIVVVNVSGRADKDLFQLARAMGDTKFKKFLHEEIERYEKI